LEWDLVKATAYDKHVQEHVFERKFVEATINTIKESNGVCSHAIFDWTEAISIPHSKPMPAALACSSTMSRAASC
jgi:hypothetical protein